MPVASSKPNKFGLYDMHGNVAEWVLDGENEDWNPPRDGETVTVERAIRWPSDIFGRYTKGGSLVCSVEECMAQSRLLSCDDWFANDADSPPSAFWFCDGDYGCSVGFRLIRPLAVPD